MRSHEVYVHLGLLDSVPKGGIQRRKIMDFIYSLRELPDTRGDFTDKDASLRERQIKIVGDYAITYWLDAPVRIVMVVDIRPADK
jgi:hypothetical protein